MINQLELSSAKGSFPWNMVERTTFLEALGPKEHLGSSEQKSPRTQNSASMFKVIQ